MTRKHFIFVLALGALLGSLAAAFGTLRDKSFQLRGYVDATQDSNLPYRISQRLGVNVELTQYSPDELTHHLDMMQAAHLTWLRQRLDWSRIEPEQGQFDWAAWDTIAESLADFPDVHMIAVLVNTPEWARSGLSPDDPTAPPNDPADFAAFAHAAAERYGAVIDYYEIWEDPNLILGWGGMNPQPAEYTAMLEAAYSAIHVADENATVMVGALAPTTETGPVNFSDHLFLRALYTYGAQDYFDAVAAKPHGFNDSPDERTVDPHVLNFSRLILVREEMVNHGDGQKAIWAASWGWNSLPEDWTGEKSIWGSVTAQEQIDYTLAALDRAEREWTWLAGMSLYHWQPDVPSESARWGFALIEPDGSSSALLQALTERNIPDAAANGLYHPETAFARYSGVWSLGELGADIGWLRDSQLDFDFYGRDVALLLREDNYVGYLYPTIDGKQANATPHDADGNAYVVLTSGDLQPAVNLVPIGRDLAEANHTLHVKTDRGWDRWALAGYAMSDGNLAAPYDRQFTVAILAVVVSGISVWVTGWGIDWRPVTGRMGILWRGLGVTSQLAISAVTSLALMIGMLLTWNDVTPNILRREPVQVGLAILTAGIIYINPAFIVTVLAALVLFVIVYHRLDFGLALTVFWAPFFLFPVELFQFAFPMVEIVVLLTGAAWILRLLVEWGRSRQSTIRQYTVMSLRAFFGQWHGLDYAVLAWVILGAISLLWAARRGLAITELRTMMLEPALFYAILRTMRPDKSTLLRLVDALLLAGFVVSVIGFITYLNPALRITAEGGAQRLTSVYGSPNNVGLFLGRCVPFALALLVLPLDRTRRVLAGIVLVTMTGALILSQSVGALFVGVPAAVVAVVILIWRRKAWLPLAGIGVLLIVGMVFALQFERFARVFDLSEGTNFFRIRVWQSSLELIGDHPLTGVGLDQFLYEFRGHYIRPDAEAEPGLSHPHNVVLDFWVRLGIAGVGVLMALQVAFWRRAQAVYRRLWRGDPLLLALAIGLIGSMVDVLAHGLVDNSVYVIDLAYVFVLLLALANALPRIIPIDDNT